MSEQRQNYYIRLNPQLNGRQNAVFPDDFPRCATMDDVIISLCDDGWLDVISPVNFEDEAEFLEKIVPSIENYELSLMETGNESLEQIKQCLHHEIKTLRARYNRAYLLHGMNCPTSFAIDRMLCIATIALNVLSTEKGMCENETS